MQEEEGTETVILDKEYRRRIADFLAAYLDLKDERYGYGDDLVITKGIQLLLSEKVFTPEELRRTALKEQRILLPNQWLSC